MNRSNIIIYHSAASVKMRALPVGAVIFALGASGAEPANMNESEMKNRETKVEAEPKVLTPEAQRALAEAEERRRNTHLAELPPEMNGPRGPEPIRYGDWERKGIASDF